MTAVLLDQQQALSAVRWLADLDPDPADGAFLGYRLAGWHDSVWQLHRMRQQPAWPTELTWTVIEQHARDHRSQSPLVIDSLRLDGLIRRGDPLFPENVARFTTDRVAPDWTSPAWTRLRWSDLAPQLGVTLSWLCTTPDWQWHHNTAAEWPARLLGGGYRDWDDVADLLAALIRAGALAPQEQLFCCWAGISALGHPDGDDRLLVYTGTSAELTALRNDTDFRHLGPHNTWPADHRWAVHAEEDFLFTVVYADDEVLTALEADPVIETWRPGTTR